MRSYLRDSDNWNFRKNLENMLCLNKQLQRWWYAARFALKPLRKEGDNIIVQWHWLKDSLLVPLQPIGLSHKFSSLVDPCGWGDNIQDAFAHHKSGRRIETGHIFVIRGAPNRLPVPAFELLELQWCLARVAAISGVAHYDWTNV